MPAAPLIASPLSIGGKGVGDNSLRRVILAWPGWAGKRVQCFLLHYEIRIFRGVAGAW